MIRSHAVPSTLASAIAAVAFMLVAAATLRAESADAAAPLSALSAARETAAPAATITPAAPLTPEAGAPMPVSGTDPKADKKTRSEVRGLLKLGASLTDRADPDFEAAEIAFRQVLNSAEAEVSDIKAALLSMGHMYRKHGDLTKAAAIYERYLADFPGDERAPDALLDLGRTLRDMGAYKLAIARFYSVMYATLKLPGDDFERYQVLAKTAQFEIAETHFAAGEYDKANAFYTKFRLLDVAPADRARAQFKAACALKLDGRNENAITAMRAFIEQWPDDENIPEARYWLATTLHELRRTQEALAVALDLLRAEKSKVAMAPKRWAYWQRRTGNQLANEFYESGDIVNAHAIYSSLLELSPEMSWRLPITYQLGLCYERLGISDLARSSYASVVEFAGPKPAAEFAELAQMAAWRIQHLDWRERITRDVDSFFDSSTGKQANVPAAASATAATP